MPIADNTAQYDRLKWGRGVQHCMFTRTPLIICQLPEKSASTLDSQFRFAEAACRGPFSGVSWII